MRVISLGRSNALKLVLLTILLVFVACVGIAHVINPDWFMKRSGVPKGGEMLTEWNRLGFQIAGAAIVAFAVYVLYTIFWGRP
jgi:hypothetical protein